MTRVNMGTQDIYIGVYKVYSVTRVRMGTQDIREIKIEVCTNTANGNPRLEVSGHAFEVLLYVTRLSLRLMWPADFWEDYSNMAAARR